MIYAIGKKKCILLLGGNLIVFCIWELLNFLHIISLSIYARRFVFVLKVKLVK